ncbi:RagB/SusD family nutrient uptake outer membrane protein, partial [Tenuifilum sp.]|nr:RagB/SusD family nutrient uptake outer membrane protein [Tenuifilum sp.]HON69519.1 RagB/SusD family nutrient uptake outer membrane protein [Tenuifilum sp.]HPP89261.1 RagB/SusD family nutrient uptake outer membrane protein [Tenuifilum sp.]
MKTLKYIIITLASVLLLWNCEDFLDFRQEGTLPTTGIDYTKSENIFLSVSAAYAKLRNWGAHVFPYVGAFEIASDNADKGSTPEDNPEMRDIDNLNFQPNNGLINALWTGYYDIVSGANYAIHQMPLFVQNLQNKSDRDYAIQCQGEAKAIRAYAYFNLTRLFGRVPIVDTVLSSEQLASLSQASTSELYAFIEKDLEEAIAVLPDGYTKEWGGRISKYTAMAIKAKVHLYQSEWDSVASLTDKIIASGRFRLLDNFREVFSMDGENSKESLFEIQSSTLGKSSGDAAYLEYGYVQGPRGNSPANMQGWGFCTPSQNLIDFYTSRGEIIRPATTLLYRGTKTPEGDSIKMSCANPVYNGKVYTPSSQNRWVYNGYGFDHNIRVIRYSDILLMYAEALVQGATVPLTCGLSADNAINMVRNRAGLPSISGATLQDIWDERRAELAMEEDRYFDLVRTNQAATA